MAKKKAKKGTKRAQTPNDTITVVLPDQLAGMDKDTLLEIAKLVFGASAKFDVSNIVFVSQEAIAESTQDLVNQQIVTSNC
jgi:hypothetical protein